ncbi:MarR family transcriptional regulator [Streptomyces sp. NBC_01622]|uniref:MarR family winged helix-turn-helix transcriptional regulator n=1 Tax=Streptomyces sp. NBC_01622 TaxID=2975903 RepID=UPI0038706404|nr:MarR family transcriptional regulator [Streptomyces sp. NBC_01622]
MSDAVTRDAVDDFMGQWAAQRTDLDLDAMGTIDRVLRLSRLVNTRLKEYFAQYDMETWEFDVLVTRDSVPGDRRSLHIALTDAGRDLVDRVVEGHVQNQIQILSALEGTDRDELTRMLRTLLISLGDTR